MNTQKKSDFELVKCYISGHQPSFDILLNRHKNRVFSYIMLIVRNQHLAEDIFQDTFIKVINSLKAGRYQEEGRFVSWVMRIAHNLIIDHFRKEKHLPTYSNDSFEVDLFNNSKYSDATVEQEMINDQVTKEVRALINELPADQREVIIMRHYMELSFKEIAEQTDVSINTALGRMRYALINLRKLIEDKKLMLTME